MSDQKDEKVSGEKTQTPELALEDIDWLNLSPEQTIMVLDKAADVFGDLAQDAFKCFMILQDRSKRASDWALGLKTMVAGKYPEPKPEEEGEDGGDDHPVEEQPS